MIFGQLFGQVDHCVSLVRSLPKIDLPKFSGKHWDWENFRDVFNSIFGSRDEVAPIIKFNYLRTHLTDEALDKVNLLTIMNENYDKAWKVLIDYYENKRRLDHAHLAVFFAVKPIKSETSAELKRLVNEVMTSIDTSTALKRHVANWGDFIVSSIVSRLDSNSRKDWEKAQGESTDPPSFQQIKSFLHTQILTLEPIEGRIEYNRIE